MVFFLLIPYFCLLNSRMKIGKPNRKNGNKSMRWEVRTVTAASISASLTSLNHARLRLNVFVCLAHVRLRSWKGFHVCAAHAAATV